MGGAVRSDQPGTVEREADRELLDHDVMDDLVIGALQEGRIDGAERLVAFAGEAGGEGHGVLLGDADIEGAGRKRLAEQIEPGAGRHGGIDGDDLVVVPRFLDQRVGEHPRIGRGVGDGLLLRAGGDVEALHAMIFVGGGLRRRIALALLGDDMDQDRPGLHVAHIAQHREQMVEIMAVDRADIIEAELFEQRAAGPEAAGIFLRPRRLLPEEFRQIAGELLRRLAQRAVGRPGDQPGEIGRHGADRRRDRHVIVVEDDDEAGSIAPALFIAS